MELIKRRAAEFGDRVFYSFADGDELTFAEFETATNALASGLADLGVKKADRVLGMMYNCLLYTSPSPRDATLSRMPSSA